MCNNGHLHGNQCGFFDPANRQSPSEKHAYSGKRDCIIQQPSVANRHSSVSKKMAEYECNLFAGTCVKL